MEIVALIIGLYGLYGIFVWLAVPYSVSKQAYCEWLQERITLIRKQQSEAKMKIANETSKLKRQSKALNTYHSQQNIKLHKKIKAVKFGSYLGKYDDRFTDF